MTDPRIEAAARAIGQMLGDETEGAYLDEARAILAAADAAAWRTIETVPANKEIVLGWAGYSFPGFKDELFSEPAEIGKFFSSKGGLKNGPLKLQPTHWQPLPAPPEGEVQE